MSAIDDDYRTIHVPRRIRHEQHERAIEVFELAVSSKRDPLYELGRLFAFEQQATHVGQDVARGKCVHADPVARRFERKHFRHSCDAALRHRVRELPLNGTCIGDGGDVDDIALALFVCDDPLGIELAHQPCALQVGVDDGVPIGFVDHRVGLRTGFDARVVDEDIHWAKRGFGAGEERLHACADGDVEGRPHGVTAGGLYLSDSRFDFFDAPGAKRHLCTVPRE